MTRGEGQNQWKSSKKGKKRGASERGIKTTKSREESGQVSKRIEADSYGEGSMGKIEQRVCTRVCMCRHVLESKRKQAGVCVPLHAHLNVSGCVCVCQGGSRTW